MNIILITKEDWQQRTQSFVFEISDKPNCEITEIVWLQSETTKALLEFHFVSTDTDSEGEEIYGWRYKSVDGKYKLLIIND